MTTSVSYGHSKSLGDIDFEQAVQTVTDKLMEGGFGVLTTIDVKATMKKKLDVDFRDYRILGACNPKMALQALTGEPLIGLLLPCNVVVFREDDGTVTVSIVNPKEMFNVIDNPGVASVADQVDQLLINVLEAL
jgi:uncharacterized protein (DUF302 family)